MINRNNIKTKWNLKLLYGGLKDPQIEKDIQAIELACTAFAKKYENRDYIATPQKLATALRQYEHLEKKYGGQKPWWYHALAGDIDIQDDSIRARAIEIQQRLTTATNKLTFFKLRIGTIPKHQQNKILKHPSVVPYVYFLRQIFQNAKTN
jgi:oligoendopeptidase F